MKNKHGYREWKQNANFAFRRRIISGSWAKIIILRCCIAFNCGYNHSRHPSVFNIFFDDEFNLIELKSNSAAVRRTCPVLKLKHAFLWLFFLFLYFFPIYHIEFCVLFFLLAWQVMLQYIFGLAISVHNLAKNIWLIIGGAQERPLNYVKQFLKCSFFIPGFITNNHF